MLENAAFGAATGAVVGPLQDQDGYHLLKVLEQRPGKEEFVHASHILLSFEAGQDTMAARNLAKTHHA